MTILITGAAGWLGRHLAPYLQRHGYNTIGLDRVGGDYVDVVADVSNRDAVFEAFANHRISAVIHSAALHKPQISDFPAQSFVDTNVSGTLHLIEAALHSACSAFVFTSTTSLMISACFREASRKTAQWLDEHWSAIQPRNIYGVTKYAAEMLCQQPHIEHGLNVIILRTARFFPEEDDTVRELSGPNLKANELLYRRATVEDMVRAHHCALENVTRKGFGRYIVSAPTPFQKSDLHALADNAATVIMNYFPRSSEIYARQSWRLPKTIDRIYDGRRISKELGFVYQDTFAAMLDALEQGEGSLVTHNAGYRSPVYSSNELGNGPY